MSRFLLEHFRSGAACCHQLPRAKEMHRDLEGCGTLRSLETEDPLFDGLPRCFMLTFCLNRHMTDRTVEAKTCSVLEAYRSLKKI